jgi:hypothetical protein
MSIAIISVARAIVELGVIRKINTHTGWSAKTADMFTARTDAIIFNENAPRARVENPASHSETLRGTHAA